MAAHQAAPAGRDHGSLHLGRAGARRKGVSAASAETDEADIAYDGEAAEIVKEIKEIIDARVRPAVAKDGGDITFHSWDHDEGVVRLNMKAPARAARLRR